MNVEIFVISLDKCKLVEEESQFCILLNVETFTASLDEFKVCIYKTEVQSILEAWLINLETFTALLDKCKVCIYRRISNLCILLNIETFIIPLEKK